MPMSLKNTLIEHSIRLSPYENIANNIKQGMIKNSRGLYTIPNQFIIIRNTIIVKNKLNNSLRISESGKKYAGIFIALRSPDEPTILPTD
jgi:hypothetical protein